MATPQQTIRSRFSLLRKSRRRHSADEDALQARPSLSTSSAQTDSSHLPADRVLSADPRAASSSSSTSSLGTGASAAVSLAPGSVPASRAYPVQLLPGPPPADPPLPPVPSVAATAASFSPCFRSRSKSHSLDGLGALSSAAGSSSASSSTSSLSLVGTKAGSVVANDATTNSQIKCYLKKSLADLRRTTSVLWRMSPKEASARSSANSQAAGRKSGNKQDPHSEREQDNETPPNTTARRQRIMSLIDSPKVFFGSPKSSLLSDDSLANEDNQGADTTSGNSTSETRLCKPMVEASPNVTFWLKTSSTSPAHGLEREIPGLELAGRGRTNIAVVLDRPGRAVDAVTAATADSKTEDRSPDDPELDSLEKRPEKSPPMVSRWTFRGQPGYNRL